MRKVFLFKYKDRIMQDPFCVPYNLRFRYIQSYETMQVHVQLKGFSEEFGSKIYIELGNVKNSKESYMYLLIGSK